MKEKKRILSVYCRYVKRILDAFFSLILIVAFLPMMFIIGIAIKIDSKGNIIFKQKRMGKDGKIFTCYKFRTMYADAPKSVPAKDFYDASKYVTRVGRFLRRSSFDELPQLFNVLKGDMSLVGPRPLIADEREVHIARAKSGVYSIRPGITGLAQVQGRNSISDGRKVELDTQYLEKLGFGQDVKIIGLTALSVVSRKNIDA